MAKGTAPQGHDLHGTSGVTFGSADRWLDTVTYRVVMAAARALVRKGDLTIRLRDRAPVRLGDGVARDPDDASSIRINSVKFLRRIFTQPDLAVGEGYVDGEWTLVSGDLAKVIGTLLANDEILRQRLPVRILSTFAQILADPHKPIAIELPQASLYSKP